MTTQQGIKLTAAIATPEDGIEHPARRRRSSLTAQLVDARVGDTVTKALLIAPELTLADVRANLAGWHDELRNSCSSGVRTARKENGGEYQIEVQDLLSGKGRMYVIALITRLS